MVTTAAPAAANTRKTSWWVGLSREKLKAEILARNDQWAKARVGPFDAVGEKLRDRWDFK